MDIASMSQAALGVFLALNLSVVIYCAIKGHPSTMEGYAVANRSLGSRMLFLSLFVTLVTSKNIGLRAAYFGVFFSFLHPISFIIGTLLLGYFVFPKLVYFQKDYTVASVMGTIYGTPARLLTVMIMAPFSIAMLIHQLWAFGRMEVFLGIPAHKLILRFGLFISFYTAVGGLRSLVSTNALQWAVFVVAFLVFGATVVNDHGGLGAIWDSYRATSSHGSTLRLRNHLLSALFWSVWPTVLISPPVVQRALAIPDGKEIRKVFVAFCLGFFLLRVVAFIVGASLFCLPDDLKGRALTLGIIVDLICKSGIGKISFVVAFIAIVMSPPQRPSRVHLAS